MKRFFCRAVALISVVATLSLMASSCTSSDKQDTPKRDFIKVENGQFMRNGKPYYFVGANMWYGAILASEGEYGDRERLLKELDLLKEMGVDNLRILIGGDGENGIPLRIEPTLQTAPGVYNQEILDGLDYLLMEMGKRDMTAVLYFNNSWEWSGGYTQYVAWATGSEVPVPTPGVEGWDGEGWTRYMESARQFVKNKRARDLFTNHVLYIVNRTNKYTGQKYVDDPTIFSWQICNEPRAFDRQSKASFAEWIHETAKAIRKLDPNHMISTGSEGFYGCEQDMKLCERIHSFEEISYINCHVWPYNWKWIDAENMESQLKGACLNTHEYIKLHSDLAAQIGKPLVVEEFGFPRDGMNHAQSNSVKLRNKYYTYVFDLVRKSAEDGGKLAGCNFWGWGGYAENIADDYKWAKGYDYTGDPAQEPQGCNSVFAKDKSTIDVITTANEQIGEACGQ